jgi:hypothetical protein
MASSSCRFKSLFSRSASDRVRRGDAGKLGGVELLFFEYARGGSQAGVNVEPRVIITGKQLHEHFRRNADAVEALARALCEHSGFAGIRIIINLTMESLPAGQ